MPSSTNGTDTSSTVPTPASSCDHVTEAAVRSHPMRMSGTSPNSEKIPPLRMRAIMRGAGPAGSERRNGSNGSARSSATPSP